MNIRPMTIEDTKTMRIDEDYRDVLQSYVENCPDLTRMGEIDGKPIFACGINIFWKGVAEGWVQVFDESHAISIVRAFRKIIAEEIAKFNLHRLQSTVRADDIRTLKLHKHLGFIYECTKSEFYPDKTDAIILRYKDEH